jgi:hypothetical protein
VAINRNDGTDEELKHSFAKALNRHGYGFQYRVLKEAWELCGRGSKWVFKVGEFPVEVQGAGTRIDFVLSRIRDRDNAAFYLLAECKRANPALSNWCFARAPFVHEKRVYGISGYEPLIMDFCQLDERNAIHVSAKPSGKLGNAYHIAVEVKSKGVKGDASGDGRQAIENAATQVSRGLNGIIEFTLGNRQFLSEGRRAHFLPVIFTTANIWVTDVDLSTANLETGNVNLSGSQFTKQSWIAFQYHLSPGLKHSRLPLERASSLNETMDADYVRTIPIVSASGIEPFLKWSSALDLEW